MATTPMQPTVSQTPGAPDPTTPPTVGDDDAGGGYEICIAVDAQGGITVSVENAADEAAENAAPGPDGSPAPAEPAAPTPAKNIKEALTIALEIYKNNGEMSENSDDADFASGFGGAQGAGGQ